MKNKLFYLSIFFLLFYSSVFSQRNKDQIQSEKIAFITKEVDLTPEEAQKFWPVYNESNKQKAEISLKLKKLNNDYIKNRDNLSEKEVEEILSKMIKLKKRQSQVNFESFEDFRAILPADKVLDYYMAEQKFKKILLKRLAK